MHDWGSTVTHVLAVWFALSAVTSLLLGRIAGRASAVEPAVPFSTLELVELEVFAG